MKSLYEKYTPNILKRLAKNFIRNKYDSANIFETYSYIIESAIGDYKEDCHYENM